MRQFGGKSSHILQKKSIYVAMQNCISRSHDMAHTHTESHDMEQYMGQTRRFLSIRKKSTTAAVSQDLAAEVKGRGFHRLRQILCFFKKKK